MSQHDQNVANDSGAAVRADINSALAAAFSLSSGASAPGTTVAYMWWADTANGLLKQRNAANSGWITRGFLGNHSSFLAYLSSTLSNVTGNSTLLSPVVCDTELRDGLGEYNAATGTFTATHDGQYVFTAAALFQDLSTAATGLSVRVATSNRTYILQDGLNAKSGALEAGRLLTTPPADLQAGDTAVMQVSVSGMAGDTADLTGHATQLFTFFGGCWVAPLP